MKEGYVLKADAAKHLTPEPITYEAMKRKSEKAAQTALKDAKASILNAAGIGKVEAYCINTVLAELKRKGLSPEQEEYKRISRETVPIGSRSSKVEEDDDVACYKRAIDELESWARSREDENARYRTA